MKNNLSVKELNQSLKHIKIGEHDKNSITCCSKEIINLNKTKNYYKPKYLFYINLESETVDIKSFDLYAINSYSKENKISIKYIEELLIIFKNLKNEE
jgi:hypothetical protein